jgi:hypothetical protein
VRAARFAVSGDPKSHHGQADWKAAAIGGALSALVNAVTLVVLALLVFERQSDEATLVLHAAIIETLPEEAEVEPAAIVVHDDVATESPAETPAAAKPVPEPPPAGAKAAGAAMFADALASMLRTTTAARPARSQAVTVTANAGNTGAQPDDWTGWDSIEIGNGAGDRRETQFFGIPAFAERIVYVVDASGSMRGERFERACQELNESIAMLGPAQNFAVFFFNDHRHTRRYPGEGDMALAIDETKTEFFTWSQNIQPEGYTHPTRVIRAALKLYPNVIFFLSDGEIPENTVRVAALDNKLGSTVIHTICFQSVEGHDLLKQMAEENSGEYRFVP